MDDLIIDFETNSLLISLAPYITRLLVLTLSIRSTAMPHSGRGGHQKRGAKGPVLSQLLATFARQIKAFEGFQVSNIREKILACC